ITLAVEAWLAEQGEPGPAKADLMAEPGAPGAFARYRNAMNAGAALSRRIGRECPAELTPQLIGLEGKRVEVGDRHGERRRFIVGKSTGWLPCHLEIPRRNATGGVGVTGAPFRSLKIVDGN